MTSTTAKTGVASESAIISALDHVRTRVRARTPGGAGEATTRALLEPMGLPFVPSVPAHTADDAMARAAEIGAPVVLKALSDEVLHKSESGLVELNLVTPQQVQAAYQRLADRVAAQGITDAVIVVQPLAPTGTDLFLGWTRDPTFGPVIVAGIGGVTVELFRDVARAVPPLTQADAEAMLASLVCAPLLNGYRGTPRVDTTRFSELVSRISDLAVAVPELAELDLNPIRVLTDGSCVALDARAVIELNGPVEQSARCLDLTPLARPSSVAVVGASRDATRPGARVVRSLRDHGFSGALYPVNPAGGEVAGLPAVRSLADLGEVPDLVCIALPAEASVAVARECVRLGVPAMIVYASGFGEAGAHGQKLERELKAVVAGTGTVLCGPNTIGVVSAHHRLAATFSQALDGAGLKASGTCLIAQSGAVAGSLVSRELAEGYGIGEWVTVGNQSQLDVADYIQYYAGLETTRSIAVFLEGVAHGAALREALRTAREAGVPVAAFKTGVTDAGRRAVASHSGALAGSEVAYSTVLATDGAVQITEMTALLEVAWTLGHAPRPAGRRAAIVTTSGGAGSATADVISQRGLEVATFTPSTNKQLANVLPGFATVDNPLDITAAGTFEPGTIRRVIELVDADPAVDIVCVVLTSITGQDAVRVAQEIAEGSSSRKPTLVAWLVDRSLAADGMKLLAERGIRVFSEPVRMVSAAAHLAAATETTVRGEGFHG